MSYKPYFKEAISTTDALKIFGIDGFKDQNELKDIYKKLSRLNHPDLGGDVEKMKQINQAYDVLKSVRSGGVSKPETWEDRIEKRKREHARYVEIFLNMKSLFLKSFDSKGIVEYLEQFAKEPLSVKITDNEESVKKDLYTYGIFYCDVEIFNKDKTTVFYVSYGINTVWNKGNGLSSDEMDMRDASYTVSTSTNIYYQKRKHKIAKRDYAGNVGFKAIDDFKTVFPAPKLKKIFGGVTKKAFKKADMFLGMKRELPGGMTIDGNKFWIYPFDVTPGGFQIACTRDVFMKVPSYNVGTIFYPKSALRLGYRLKETEEDLNKLIKFVQVGYETAKKKNLNPQTDGKQIAEIYKDLAEKIFKKD